MLLSTLLLLLSCQSLRDSGFISDVPEETATNVAEITAVGVENYLTGGVGALILGVLGFYGRKYTRNKKNTNGNP